MYVTDLPRGGADLPVVRIASMIADPQNHAVERYSDTFTTSPTATAQPDNSLRISWNPTGLAPPAANLLQLPWTDFGAFAFRDAVRSLVYHNQKQPAHSAGARQFYLGQINIQNAYAIEAGSETQLDFMYFQAMPASTWSPHGPIVGMGKALGRVGVWIDATVAAPTTAIFQVGEVALDAAALRLTSYVYNAGRWIQAQSATTGTGSTSVSVTVDASGYYAFEFNNLDSINHTYSQFHYETHADLQSSWAHLPLNQVMPTNALNIQELRILAVSLWLQNNASPNTQQGSLVVAQMNPQQDWYTGLADSGNLYNAVFGVGHNEAQKRLAVGYYGFLKPTKETDFAPMRPFVGPLRGFGGGTVAAMLVSATFDLETPHAYLALAATTNTQGAGDCNLTYAAAAEFSTTNEWFGSQLPTLMPEDWQASMVIVKTMRQHYDNDTHWSEILRSIGNFGKLSAPALSALGPVGQALGLFASTAGGIATQVADYIDARKRQVQATQAQEASEALAGAALKVRRRY